jgi:2-methylcitrate dehydratase PrpD
MDQQDRNDAINRRMLLGAGTSVLLAMPGVAWAQQDPAAELKKSDKEPVLPAGRAKTLSRVVAEYVAGFDLKSVPAEVIERARTGFIDTIGVMLAGSRQDVSRILCDMVRLEGSTPSVSIVGQSLRASPQLAALANGVAAHAMDYDLTYISGQSVSAVIPAILPVAESTGATPAEGLAAFIIGCEVAGRIVRSNFKASSVGGWHTTGMVGVIAATAACARLLKLPVDQTAQAIGISTSLASGISVNFGTMTKPLHSGHAARDAIMAALLAARGFTSSPLALEAPNGYFGTFGRGLDVSVEPFKDLGRRYDLVAIGYDIKPYPCGGLTHTAIEAALALRGRLSARLSDIAGIHCFVTRNAESHAGTAYPQSIENAKFSVSYLLAYALVHGAPKITAFTEAALQDDKVKALAKTVSASVDPELGPGTGFSPARLKITMSDGEVIEQRNDYASGSSHNPMTQAQVEEKFLDCAAQSVSSDVAGKILAQLNALPGLPSFAEFWPLVRLG